MGQWGNGGVWRRGWAGTRRQGQGDTAEGEAEGGGQGADKGDTAGGEAVGGRRRARAHLGKVELAAAIGFVPVGGILS